MRLPIVTATNFIWLYTVSFWVSPFLVLLSQRDVIPDLSLKLIKFSSSFCFIFHLIGLQSLTHSTPLKTRICAYIFDVSNFVLHVCLVFKRSYMRQWKRQNTNITLSKILFSSEHQDFPSNNQKANLY